MTKDIFIPKHLTVLVGTCDKYEPLWENFLTCFNRYWQLPTEIIFVGETKEVPSFPGTPHRTILCGPNKPWGERMREGIEASGDYVFFILDDYFFHFAYGIDTIYDYLQDAIKYEIERLQISPSGHQNYLPKSPPHPYNKFCQNSGYLISMQPSIWDRQFLLDTLQPNYSPWDFEIVGSRSLLIRPHKIYADLDAPPVYFNAVRRGLQKSVGWESFRKQENLKQF